MRIIWSSNAPWINSGYGVQTRHIVPRLASAGHDMALIAWSGLEGAKINLNGIPVYPKGGALYGQDVLGIHSLHHQADISITLIDAWVYNASQIPAGVRWVPYFPIDSEPVSPRIVDAVRGAYERIVFSRFACDQMEQAGLSYLYAPHMVDTNVYAPGDQRAARQRLNLPDGAHVTGVVAANKGVPSRKSWPQLLEAWVRFACEHDDAVLYLHTMPGGDDGGSVNLMSLLASLSKRYQVDLSRRVVWIDAYSNAIGLPDDFMADVYRSMDVLLSPSMGEGFGVPILEAQACGTPVITGDWTAMPEITFAGWKVSRTDADPFWITGYDTYQFMPRIDAIAGALEQAHRWWREPLTEDETRTDLRHAARQGALAYDCETVMRDYWLPAIGELEGRVKRGHGEMQLVTF